MESPSGISLSSWSEELEMECSNDEAIIEARSPEHNLWSEIDPEFEPSHTPNYSDELPDSDSLEESDFTEVVSEDELSLALAADGPLYHGSSVTVLQAVVMFLYFILR